MEEKTKKKMEVGEIRIFRGEAPQEYNGYYTENPPTDYLFFVFKKLWEHKGIFLEYDPIGTYLYGAIRSSLQHRPRSMQVMTEDEADERFKELAEDFKKDYPTLTAMEIHASSVHGLYIPEQYYAEEAKKIVVEPYPAYENTIKKIRKREGIVAILGFRKKEPTADSHNASTAFQAYCFRCDNFVQLEEKDGDMCCKECGASRFIANQDFKKSLNGTFIAHTPNAERDMNPLEGVEPAAIRSVIMIEAKNDHIIITKALYEGAADKSGAKELLAPTFKLACGRKGGMAGGIDSLCDPSALFVNNGEIENSLVILNGAKTLDELILKNRAADNEIGFVDLFSDGRVESDMVNFINYIALATKYPVMKELLGLTNRDEIISLLKDLRNGNKNSETLKKLDTIQSYENADYKMPVFVTDWLRKRNEGLDKLIMWYDICRYEQMTEEYFKEIVESYGFRVVSAAKNFPDIVYFLSYGLTVSYNENTSTKLP